MKVRRRIQFLASGLFLVNLAVYFLKPGGEKFLLYFGDLFTPLCALLACLGLRAACSRFGATDLTKRAWQLVLAGVFTLLLADSLYAFLELALKVDLDNVFPSLADLFYVLAYFPIAIGLAMFLVGYRRGGLSFGRWQAFLLPAAALLALIVAGVAKFVLVPIVADQETSALAKAVYLFYPVADFVVLTLASLLVYLTSLLGRGLFSRPWRYMALGFLALTIGDILYAYFSWSSSYSTGNLTDLGWNAAYLLIAVGGYFQREIMEAV